MSRRLVVVDFLEQEFQDISHSMLSTYLKDLYSHILSLPLSSQCKDLLKRSYAAFDTTLSGADESQIAGSLNGYILTDLESDSAEDYVSLTSVASESAKKRKSLN